MLSRLATRILRLLGWQTVLTPPPGPKTVIMIYPHTSNWDFPLGLLFKAKHRMSIHWAGKDSLFRWPLAPLFRRLGGIPINRRQRTGRVSQLAQEFSNAKSFHFCIAPEGTRAKTDHLKTGFYRLALAAQVPLGLGFFDYKKKSLGIERWITLSGNEEADLNELRAYYAKHEAYDPAKASDIRFNTEQKHPR